MSLEKKNISVLIVDSDSHFRSTLGFELKSHGHEVSMASSGIKAFEHFPDMPFDVIIADLAMPAGNGLAVLRTLKDKNLPIPVIITTTDRALEREKVISAGAAALLYKPLVTREVIEKIREIGGLPDNFSFFLNAHRSLVVVSWIGEIRVKDKKAIEKCLEGTLKTGARYVVLNLPGCRGYAPELAEDIGNFQERIKRNIERLILCGLESSLREKMLADKILNEGDVLPTLKDSLQYIIEMGTG